jgi:hypothetical protein
MSPPEQRRSQRHRLIDPAPWEIPVTVNGRTCQATLHDVSDGGLSLLLGLPVQPGTPIAFAGEPALWGGRSLLHVVHCTPLASGRYHVGCRFCGRND